MKDPQKILDAFRTRSDEAARILGELRQARDRMLRSQVEVLRSIELAYNDSRRDRALAGAASGYARRALKQAADFRREAEKIAEAEMRARDQLLERFADQKRFELYMAQRQLKERALRRKREEKDLLEQIDQLEQAKARQESR